MKLMHKLTMAALTAFLLTTVTPVQASELLYSQLADGQSTFGPSELWIPNIDSEVADDFDVVGNIDRVVASGFASPGTTFQGVNIRFYEYLPDGTPGALQQGYFLTTGYSKGTIDVTLSPPLAATGKHFVSVQQWQMNGWYWRSANTNAP